MPRTIIDLEDTVFVTDAATTTALRIVSDPNFRIRKVLKIGIGNGRMGSHPYEVGRIRFVFKLSRGSTRLAFWDAADLDATVPNNFSELTID